MQTHNTMFTAFPNFVRRSSTIHSILSLISFQVVCGFILRFKMLLCHLIIAQFFRIFELVSRMHQCCASSYFTNVCSVHTHTDKNKLFCVCFLHFLGMSCSELFFISRLSSSQPRSPQQSLLPTQSEILYAAIELMTD